MPKTNTQITSEEAQAIEAAYQDLVTSTKAKLDEVDKTNIRQAFELANKAHSKQRRKSGEPYIFHPIAVAKITAEEIGLGATAIISALLHDVVEDTVIEQEEIDTLFGERIGLIVDGLTKLDGTYKSEHQQAENFKKVLSTLVQDVRVVLIKMADRLHNMRTIGSMPKHKQIKIGAETSYIYAPLAHRLGLYQIKTEFQDLCMKILNSDEYIDIEERLKETEEARNKYIDVFLQPLLSELNKSSVNYVAKSRTKSIYSIWNKIKTKGVDMSEIYDIFAVRIIIDPPRIEDEKKLCWEVYSVITDVYKPIAERLKDWVTSPKANGYESLHTTVVGPKGRFVEIQIRTSRMDDIAERGFAAHWKYKGQKMTTDHFGDWLDNVRDILDNNNSNAMEFINDFKTNLFNEEVYVYTPMGDMKVMPKGASALDFAFSIHTDVGYRCTSIKVNGKLEPMGYELKNGDKVDVVTRRNQKPSESWLKYVITGKARSKIRSAMKEEKKKKGELAKEALTRKLKNLKIDFDENIEILIKYYGLQSRPDLYYEIYLENIKLQDLSKYFDVVNGRLQEKVDEDAQVETAEVKKTVEETILKNAINKGKTNLVIDGQPANTFQYSFATCCNPLPGDQIFAYPVTNQGLKIHRVNCPNATAILSNFGYRVVDAGWNSENISDFATTLRVKGIDSGVGVIQAITDKLANQLKIDIRSLNISGDQGTFTADLQIVVINKDHLNQVKKALLAMPQVSHVERINQ